MAVVAVDPTSPFTGGALLGDRIRMESVALDEGVYIRSMASRGSLGGLATSTREVCDLLDAAGFDRILVETVGVGQSELDVARIADATVLVLVPESGDGIQTLKSGVMEVADVFVVNKADRPGRREAAPGDRGHAGHPAGQRVPARPGAPWRGSRRRSSDGRRAARSPTRAATGDAWDSSRRPRRRRQGRGDARADRRARPALRWLERAATLDERRRRRLLDRTREVVDRATRRWVWEETRAEQRIAGAARRRSPRDGPVPTTSRPRCSTASSRASAYDTWSTEHDADAPTPGRAGRELRGCGPRSRPGGRAAAELPVARGRRLHLGLGP